MNPASSQVARPVLYVSRPMLSNAARQIHPIRMATPRAVLFDLDGTLIDTMQVFADVAADVMVRHHGIDRVAARHAYLATSGIPFFKQLEVIAPGDKRNAAASDEFERRKIEATGDVDPSETTLEALAHLRARGIEVGVCSNNFQDQVDRFAERCSARFALALGFGNGLAKGQTQFDHACQTLGVERDELVFVGDSIADANLAIDYGMRFVGRLGTFDARTFGEVAPEAPVVAELTELLTLFV